MRDETFDSLFNTLMAGSEELVRSAVILADLNNVPIPNSLREQTGVWNLPSAGWEYTHTDGHKIVAVWVADSGPWKGVASKWLGTYMRVEYGEDKASITVPAKLTGTDKPLRVHIAQYLVRRQDGTFTGMRGLIAAGYRRTRSWGGLGNLSVSEVMSMGITDHPEDRTLRLGLTYEDGPAKGLAMAWDHITHVEWTNTDGVTRRYDDGVMSEVKPEKPEPPKKWQCIAVDKIMIDAMRGQWCHVGAFSNIDTGQATVQTKMRIESINPTPPYIVGEYYSL